MLVGDVPFEDYSKLFSFLWDVESRLFIDKTDKLSLAQDTTFRIEIVEGSKPVCHDVRRCSR